MKTILAVDPGASGGLAVSSQGLLEASYCLAMPDTEGDLVDFLSNLTIQAESNTDHKVAYVEAQVGVMGPNLKVSSSAMFTFGEGYGFIKGVLQASGWQIVLVRPQKWQKALSLGSKAGAGGKTPWKNKLKAEAQRRFPHLSVTLKTADALLLLDYACNLEK